MPRIEQFDAGNLALRPSEIGPEAMAAAARREGQFYNQVAEATRQVGQQAGRDIGGGIAAAGQAAVTYETHREVNQGVKTFSDLTLNLENQWNDYVKNLKDPNQPGIAEKFLNEQVKPQLENWQGGFNTDKSQAWATQHAAGLLEHLTNKTTADVSTLAGIAAHNNVAESINTLSNVAYKDPSSLDFALKSFDSGAAGIVSSSPNLKATDAARVQAEISDKGRASIVKAAAIGYIEKTGDVPAWASDPKYSKYVSGVELRQFQKQADAQKKANLYYDRMAETQKKQQADLKLHQDVSDLIGNTITVDPNNPNRYLVSPDAKQKTLDLLRKNHEAPSAATAFGTLDRLYDHLEHPEQVTTDPATKAALLTGLSDPNRPTAELDVLRAAADGKLSPHDTTILREMVKTIGPDAMHDPLAHAALTGAGERVGQHLMIDGQERYSNFLQSFWPEYLKQKRAGTLPANALNLNDPSSLIRQSLSQWEPTQQQRLQAAVLKNLQSTAPQPETPSPQPALPPREKLEDGKLYDTARGKLKWDAKRGMFVTP